MEEDAEPADQVAAAPAQRRDRADHARADVLEPFAGERGREAQEDDRDGEDPDDVGQQPVVGRRRDDAEHADQRRVVDAPRIDRADAKVNGDRSGRHEPTIERRRRDDALFRQQARHRFPSRPILSEGFPRSNRLVAPRRRFQRDHACHSQPGRAVSIGVLSSSVGKLERRTLVMTDASADRTGARLSGHSG